MGQRAQRWNIGSWAEDYRLEVATGDSLSAMAKMTVTAVSAMSASMEPVMTPAGDLNASMQKMKMIPET